MVRSCAVDEEVGSGDLRLGLVDEDSERGEFEDAGVDAEDLEGDLALLVGLKEEVFASFADSQQVFGGLHRCPKGKLGVG